jgi:hypothetical protein
MEPMHFPTPLIVELWRDADLAGLIPVRAGSLPLSRPSALERRPYFHNP